MEISQTVVIALDNGTEIRLTGKEAMDLLAKLKELFDKRVEIVKIPDKKPEYRWDKSTTIPGIRFEYPEITDGSKYKQLELLAEWTASNV